MESIQGLIDTLLNMKQEYTAEHTRVETLLKFEQEEDVNLVNLQAHLTKLSTHKDYQHYQILLQVSFKNQLEAFAQKIFDYSTGFNDSLDQLKLEFNDRIDALQDEVNSFQTEM